MAIERKKVVTVSLSLVALAASGVVFFAMFGPEGCGPSEEEQRLLATLNGLEEILDKGGYVKQVEMIPSDDGDAVYRYEADIVNDQGVAIGRLRGGRVEGFGTMKPRIQWYKTPGVAEEWVHTHRERRGRRGPRQRQ